MSVAETSAFDEKRNGARVADATHALKCGAWKFLRVSARIRCLISRCVDLSPHNAVVCRSLKTVSSMKDGMVWVRRQWQRHTSPPTPLAMGYSYCGSGIQILFNGRRAFIFSGSLWYVSNSSSSNSFCPQSLILKKSERA